MNGLRDVTPTPTKNDAADRLLADTISATQVVQAHAVGGQVPNGAYVLLSEFGCAVALTLTQPRLKMARVTVTGSTASLLRHVDEVVELCTKSEVGRANTGTVIADVHKDASGGLRAVDFFPSDPMRSHGRPMDDSSAITETQRTRPNPALARLIDLVPERDGFAAHVHDFTRNSAA